MPARRKKRVAILGGGMAGLTAAWSLSDPALRGEFDVSVYERAPFLGGKGASMRGVHGRIEEHGLHVWLGYYDNAFRVIREVYEELDRPGRDPGCPIATWRDAFAPSDLVGVEERQGGTRSHWVAAFARNGDEPGAPAGAAAPLSPATFLRRGLTLLLDFSRSIERRAPGVVISGSPEPPSLGGLLRQAKLAGLVGAVESFGLLEAALPLGGPLSASLSAYLERLRAELLDRARSDHAARRSLALADMVISSMQGAVRDGLLGNPPRFGAIDHLDFRDWLARHGARRETLESPLIRGMYDLVFAYADGDPERPRFPAGLGLFLSGKLFFEYRGSIFWRMRAGMGDVVFVPLYQALRARGVKFRFRHRVDRLRLSRDRTTVGSVHLTREAASDRGGALVRVKGVPCFSSYRGVRARGEPVVLRAGEDFDGLVLATSLGGLSSSCAELAAESRRWREMLEGLATVPTQSLQLWLGADESELGWPYPSATVSGCVAPFQTYASMSHLLPREAWPDEERPRALAYLCSVLPRAAARDAARARHLVHENATRFLARDAGHLWPGAVGGDGAFRWELLCGANGARGPSRLASQYARANVDPADQYVQALPGTDSLRLTADGSGYDNLFLAGDWIDCGLNAGCIEAAVLAGVQAANALSERRLTTGVLGSWMAVGER